MSRPTLLKNKRTQGHLVALAFLAMSFNVVHANNTPPHSQAAQSSLKREARQWSENNPHSVVVSIRLGTQKTVHPKTGERLGIQALKDRIKELYAQHNMHDVHFFIGQNDQSTPTFSLHRRGRTSQVFRMEQLPSRIFVETLINERIEKHQ